jgi:hypothetical protein
LIFMTHFSWSGSSTCEQKTWTDRRATGSRTRGTELSSAI